MSCPTGKKSGDCSETCLVQTQEEHEELTKFLFLVFH